MTRLRRQVAVQLVLLLLVAGWASAQNTNGGNNQQTTQTNNNQQTTTGGNSPATTANTNNNQNTTPTTSANKGTTNANTNTNTQATGQTTGITGVPTAVTTSKSSSSSSGSDSGPSDLPTIAGYGIPTQGVPWTGGATFMYKSSLPEGTVFIAVGAILGAMGAAVLAWRALVAWSLHRSVKRANEKMLAPVDGKLTKGGYRATTIPLASSNLSLDRLGPGNRKSIARPSTTSARPTSLFFSPTAGAGNHTSMYSNANRSSTYLPSGYYAAPGAAPPGSSHVGSGTNRSAFARNSQYNVSPPSSPGLPPSRGGASINSTVYNQPSISSLNLHVPGNAHPGGRAPSANLDELFGNDPAGRR